LHHTNIEDAEADHRKLVCFDCGIACDMTQMREERIVYLRKLDARKDKPNLTPSARRAPNPDGTPFQRGRMEAPRAFDQVEGARYRLHYQKRGRGAFISHLDTMRLLVRVFRRAGVEMIYTKGFHPKPQLVFAPALGLGIASLAELCDVRVDWSDSDEELRDRLRAAAPEGLVIESAKKLTETDQALSKLISMAEYASWIPRVVDADGLRREGLTVTRLQKGVRKTIDVGAKLLVARVATAEESAALATALEWPAGGTILVSRVRVGDEGGAKPSEVVEALLGGVPPEGTRYARVALGSAPAEPTPAVGDGDPIAAA
jgi:radical SAM-linked protein